jgi:hypothetical protein
MTEWLADRPCASALQLFPQSDYGLQRSDPGTASWAAVCGCPQHEAFM